jgi:hypothetical protein
MSMTEMERRDYPRLHLHAVVGIDTVERKDRVGVTRNLSATGALFHSASAFDEGETLSLIFRDPVSKEEQTITAVVVRTDVDPPSVDSHFPHLTAVKFDRPLPR